MSAHAQTESIRPEQCHHYSDTRPKCIALDLGCRGAGVSDNGAAFSSCSRSNVSLSINSPFCRFNICIRQCWRRSKCSACTNSSLFAGTSALASRGDRLGQPSIGHPWHVTRRSRLCVGTREKGRAGPLFLPLRSVYLLEAAVPCSSSARRF